jgi:hypothetical protein
VPDRVSSFSHLRHRCLRLQIPFVMRYAGVKYKFTGEFYRRAAISLLQTVRMMELPFGQLLPLGRTIILVLDCANSSTASLYIQYIEPTTPQRTLTGAKTLANFSYSSTYLTISILYSLSNSVTLRTTQCPFSPKIFT